jgi:hypothetical protein
MAASGRVPHSVPRVTCREHPYHPPRGVLAATPLPRESAPARPLSRSADNGPSLPQGDTRTPHPLKDWSLRKTRSGSVPRKHAPVDGSPGPNPGTSGTRTLETVQPGRSTPSDGASSGLPCVSGEVQALGPSAEEASHCSASVTGARLHTSQPLRIRPAARALPRFGRPVSRCPPCQEHSRVRPCSSPFPRLMAGVSEHSVTGRLLASEPF